MEKTKSEKILTGGGTAILLAIYLACFIYGAIEYPHQVTSTSPLLVMLSSLGGMQKTIPEGVFFNGGNSFADLQGSDAELASFFRSAKGYRYAIFDTMGDLVDCFLGSLLFQILVIPLRRKKNDFGADLIRFIPKKDLGKSPAAAKPL